VSVNDGRYGSRVNLQEALAERSSNKHRLDQIKHRLTAAARHQEDEIPPESAADLTEQYETLTIKQVALIARINLTNAGTLLPDGGPTLTEALAQRDGLRTLHKVLSEAESTAAGAGRYEFRAMRTEIRHVPGLNVVELRRRLDDLGERIRKLDAEIQLVGGTTELAGI
jgi:hypothetical protein